MQKAVLLLLAILLPAISWGQFNLQPDKVTKKYFPDPEIEINTPAFAKKSGYTSYDEMMAWLGNLDKKYLGKMTISFIGESQKGKKIPKVVLANPSGTTVTKVWMQGGLHGDEPGGTEAMLFLIERLLADQTLAKDWQGIELSIVPMANIDGYEVQKRQSANGIDLNRDQTSLRAPESVVLKRAFNTFNPAVALDFHEYRPFRKDFSRFGKEGIAGMYDAMFLYSGNLNVPEELRNLTKSTFVDSAKHSLDHHQLRHHDYATPQKYGGKVEFNLGSVHSRSSATSFALANSVSTLLEIRGVGLCRTSFKRRVFTSYMIALSYLKSASQNQAKLKTVLSQTAGSRQPVTVTSERKLQKDSLEVLDLATERPVKIPFVIHNALESQPVLQRARPTAYILLASQRKAISRLSILGLKIDSLSADKEIEVESLNPGALHFDSTGYEEDEQDNDSTKAKTANVRKAFSKGTYILYLNQDRANLACEVLEPESPNGFLANKIIRVKEGEEYPVYRYLRPEKIQ